ncbi:MAG TPA: N-acetylmuramoyl-L-alanine amidase [Acidobacteriota bacterium]|nr:N-acetylmuramoyl-L-alanine amidase [Acidobacteriota bacterium]
MMGKQPVRVYSIAVLLLSLSLCASAKDTAKDYYDRAMDLEQQLKGPGKGQQNLAQWKQVVEAYRKVYYSYPSSGYCDNSLFRVGALYAEMGGRFHDSLYYRRASSTFQFLIEQYPSSSLIEEAMLEYIRINRSELKNVTDARAMEARLRKISPETAASALEDQSATATQPASLKSVRHYTGTDYTRIVLDFDKEVSFKRNRLSDPDRLYFDFDNTVALKELLDQNFQVDDGFLKQIRVGQNSLRTARVVLDLKSIESFEVFPLYHPYRLVIDVQGTKAVAAAPVAAAPLPPVAVAPATTLPPVAVAPTTPPAATPAMEIATDTQSAPAEMAQANTSGKYSLARQLGLKVRRIVVDAGHGGHDPGAMHNGLRECDITLDVSQRLKRILETEYGFEVLMTRNDDRFVALEERTAFANSHSADLFVSIHVNSSRNRRAKGVETYYLNFATTPEAMEVAARENAIAEKNMGELQKLTTAIALNTKIEESRDFAGLIQTGLVGRLQKDYPISSLGVKQAPFYVLIGAQMPSILAEISFISNQRESELLDSPTYRQSVAEGLSLGVKNYIETLAESRLTRNFPAGKP